MDVWQQHVCAEISDAFGDDERMLVIAKALVGMDQAELIPQQISDQLFNQISVSNEGGEWT